MKKSFIISGPDKQVIKIHVTQKRLNIKSLSIILLKYGTYKLRPTLKIVLFPLTRPCITGMGRSVRKLFFLTSQIGYPLNLIVYSKTCLKRPLNNRQKIVCFIKTDFCIMQVKSIAECSQGALCNTSDLPFCSDLICLNDLCCVYL